MTLDAVLADLQSARSDALAVAPSVVPPLDVAIADVQAMLGTTIVPDWPIPPVGSIATVGNALMDVDPCPSGTCSYSGVTKLGGFMNDTALAYLPLLGPLGSIGGPGGGHNDYYGNLVARWDVKTGLWSLLTLPHDVIRATSPPLPAGDKSIGYHAHATYGELWADATFTTTLQDQPGACHAYGYAVALPIGPQGTLFMGCRPALTPVGSAHGRQAHVMDLDAQVAAGPNVSRWQRVGGLNTSLLPAYGGAVYDAKRNRVYGTQSTGTDGTMYYMDVATWTPTKTTIAMGAFYGTLMRSAEFDRMVYMRRHSAGIVFRVIDPNTGKVFSPQMTGDLPPYDSVGSPLGGGCDWWPKLPGGPGFIYYGGGGERAIYKCQPTGNPDTDAWNWVAQTLPGGDAPVVQLSPSQCTHMGRFKCLLSVDGCGAWVPNSGRVQIFRVY